jgi:hypothetical protein
MNVDQQQQHTSPSSSLPHTGVQRAFDGSRLLDEQGAISTSTTHSELDHSGPVLAYFAHPEEQSTNNRLLARRKRHRRPGRAPSLSSGIFVVLGIGLLIGVTGKPQPVSPTASHNGQATIEVRQRLENASLTATTASKITYRYAGISRGDTRYPIRLEAFRAADLISVRLAIGAHSTRSADSEVTFQGAEADPATLSLIEPDRWLATVPLFISLVARDGTTERVVGEARIELHDDGRAPTATVDARYPVETQQLTRAGTQINFSEKLQLELTSSVD